MIFNQNVTKNRTLALKKTNEKDNFGAFSLQFFLIFRYSFFKYLLAFLKNLRTGIEYRFLTVFNMILTKFSEF